MVLEKENTSYFVDENSIVRQIWGSSDTILLIFAGAAAEFALNKAVDWLYFTGKLPADPLKRLFSTVSYARQIVFASYSDALLAIDKIASIHKGVENQRGQNIPDWAYRDVLYLLIDYSIRAYELLERKLDMAEKEEVFDVFYRLGTRMRLKDLPNNYEQWLVQRNSALATNLQYGDFTKDLYLQYRKHLGALRFFILKQAQRLLVPQKVNELLGFGKNPLAVVILGSYKMSRLVGLQQLLKNALLPVAYKEEIKALDAFAYRTSSKRTVIQTPL
ncbi:oxygenase MpaB family protein [Pedobacter sp. KR3-3]|uniref:Oxygenase MpaB family protein n=1 Tax=Pedobacter albus TaxID=3113905 RepID=A0ABU7IAH2_9SPHI|nr:oxygenase MpaB family protein [Pedobacter sp. KR3-3]MEE1946356.1 oxygenase MpaB family protein [Pedobacter sp. KR3-3]